jgi:transposase-like protein
MRRNSNVESRRAHVDKWKQSGLSMSEYCRQHDLAISSFSVWVQMNKNSSQEFKPITITPPTLLEKQVNVVEIIVEHRLKLRLLNVIDYKLIVNIAKELVRCN